MLDFRLRVFERAAHYLSFSKAAEALYISQPAVSKHIKELEAQYGLRLFDRKGNFLLLTPAGTILLAHAQEMIHAYDQVDRALGKLRDSLAGRLYIGASTTICQYVIPEILAYFRERHPELQIRLTNGNTNQIEESLLRQDIDLGIIEGRSKNRQLRYTHMLEDELVLVCSTRQDVGIGQQIKQMDELLSLTFVNRERGSGTLEVIEHHLRQHGIQPSQLRHAIEIESTEGIKRYLHEAPVVAFMSVHAIAQELHRGQMRIIELPGFSIQRPFQFINRQGDENETVLQFMSFCQKHYNHR